MKLPFVSRETFDLALSAERRRADAEHENAQDLRRVLSDLTAKYHALKLQGAVLVEPPPALVAAPVSVDPVKAAIRQQVAANPDMPGLGAYLGQLVRELRAETPGIADATLIRRLSTWDSSEALSAPVDSVVEGEDA